MAALFAWGHLTERALVLSLFLKLPVLKSNDGKARIRRPSFDHQSVGAEIRARNRQADSFVLESHKWLVASGRDSYIEIWGKWKYLYRAVDSQVNTLDFMLRAKRDGKAATCFFHKVLGAKHTQTPRVITVDKNAAYPVAMDELKQDKTFKAETELRQSKYLNNIIEQDHRNVKRTDCETDDGISIV